MGRPDTNGFIGLENYWNLLHDARFLNSLKVTTIFSLTSVILELILGIAIALVLNQRFKGRGFVRGLIILPWAIPSIVNAAANLFGNLRIPASLFAGASAGAAFACRFAKRVAGHQIVRDL